MFSSQDRLNNAYKNAKVIPFDDRSKFILFSDCHRSDNSMADDFADNKNIYNHALKHYFNAGFSYCELGDGNELWENISFAPIFEAYKDVFMILKKFHLQNRLHLIWGNHDMVYKNPNIVQKHLFTYFNKDNNTVEELLNNVTYHEAIVLRHAQTQQEIFLAHGHQADPWNYTFWKLSRLLVRILWKPLNVMGIPDPTKPAKNYKELIKVERRTKKWISNNNNLITVMGHTHRPRFPEPGEIALFNDGSCIHPRCITGIEIEDGKISLIMWQINTTEEGYLQIVRSVLEGPKKLIKYKTD